MPIEASEHVKAVNKVAAKPVVEGEPEVAREEKKSNKTSVEAVEKISVEPSEPVKILDEGPVAATEALKTVEEVLVATNEPVLEVAQEEQVLVAVSEPVKVVDEISVGTTEPVVEVTKKRKGSNENVAKPNYEIPVIEISDDNDGTALENVNKEISDINLNLEIRKILSAQKRTVGNQAFLKKKDQEAINLYSEAVFSSDVATEDGKKDCSLALANRSAVWIKLKKYEECLDDINAAIYFKYPHNMLYKLFGGSFPQEFQRLKCGSENQKAIDFLKFKNFRLSRCQDNGLYHETKFCNQRRISHKSPSRAGQSGQKGEKYNSKPKKVHHVELEGEPIVFMEQHNSQDAVQSLDNNLFGERKT